MHEQRFMFFHPEDVKNGMMDEWMKSIQINQWERHDNEDCQYYKKLKGVVVVVVVVGVIGVIGVYHK